MPNNKRYLKWCRNQNKGIRLIQPSENLVRAYLGKSQNAIKSMDTNAKTNNDEWVIAPSYYAQYFAVYALFAKIGLKCEIHDCTIALFDHLFHDKVSSGLVQQLRQSKQQRVDAQYYTHQIKTNVNELSKNTKNFVVEIEEIIDNMTSQEVATFRSMVRKL